VLPSTAVFGFCVACLSCLGLTPLVRRMAIRERPPGRLPAPSLPTTNGPEGSDRPQLGGLAIYTSVVTALVASYLVFPLWRSSDNARFLAGVILSGGLVVVLGLIDDLQGTLPWKKLLTQAVAVVLLQVHIDALGLSALMGPQLHFFLALLLLLWMLGLSNAMNLIDGLDGLAAGVATAGAVGMAAVAWVLGLTHAALVAAAVAGASLAFLRQNAPPARIIMGDTGSMFLGFVLAGVGAVIFWSQPSVRTLLGLVLLSWVPALDAVYAVVRRWMRGESIFRGDLGHVHHRLLDAGFSARSAGLSLSGLAALSAAAGAAVILQRHALLWTAALVLATVPLAWIVRPQALLRTTTTARPRDEHAVSQDRAA